MGNCVMDYYTYIHSSPDGEVFYVGKGNGRRVYSMHDRSWIWRERFNQLDGITMKIVSRFETEKEAFEHEKELIQFYKAKGCNLVNLTEGGSGPFGYKFSDERRELIRKRMTGYKHEIITCPHCGDTGGATSMKRWHFDNCVGPTKRFKARVTLNGERIYLGKFSTKEEADAAEEAFYSTNPRPTNTWIGRKHSDVSRKKMSETHTGMPGSVWSDESRRKMSEKRIGALNPFYGKKHTPDASAKISEANARRARAI